MQWAIRLSRPGAMILVDNVARFGGVGGLLAALALLAHGRTPFVVLLAANAASYVVAGLIAAQLPAVRPAERLEAGATGYREVLRDRGYAGLALLNVIMALHDSLLLVAMPLWIATRTKAPLSLTGLLFALNTVLVVLLQVRTTRNIAARGGIARGYRAAAVSFALACGAFALAAGAPAAAAIVLLVVALGALTSAELENSAGEWVLSVELAPPRLRERYISVFKTSMTVQQAVGPLLVTTVLAGWGRLGWLALALLLTTGTLASRWLGTRQIARRVRPATQTPPPRAADEFEPAAARHRAPDGRLLCIFRRFPRGLAMWWMARPPR